MSCIHLLEPTFSTSEMAFVLFAFSLLHTSYSRSMNVPWAPPCGEPKQ